MNFKQWLFKEDISLPIKQICSNMDWDNDSIEKLGNDLEILAHMAQEAGNHTKASDIMHAKQILPITKARNVGESYKNLITNGSSRGFLSFSSQGTLNCVLHEDKCDPYVTFDTTIPADKNKSITVERPYEYINYGGSAPLTQAIVQNAIDTQTCIKELIQSSSGPHFSKLVPRNAFSNRGFVITGAFTFPKLLDWQNLTNAYAYVALPITGKQTFNPYINVQHDHPYFKSKDFMEFILNFPEHTKHSEIHNDFEPVGYRPKDLLAIRVGALSKYGIAADPV